MPTERGACGRRPDETHRSASAGAAYGSWMDSVAPAPLSRPYRFAVSKKLIPSSGRSGRHLQGALESEREHRLLYDESLCLRAIVAAADAEVAGPTLPADVIDRAMADHDALVRRLGLVRRSRT